MDHIKAPSTVNRNSSIQKLSQIERNLLITLYQEWIRLKSSAYPFLDSFGVPWRLSRMSASRRASLSRSLRRLEERGLVLRQNTNTGSGEGTGRCRVSAQERHTRTNAVRLLDDGAEVAKRLTGSEILVVNRFGTRPGA